MAVEHYENFPVASLLLPRRLRLPVRDIYRYARTADDIADEGCATPQERLHELGEYRKALQQIDAGKPALPKDHPLGPVFNPLRATITAFNLPMTPFLDLLSAFEQDVTTHRYDSDAQLLDYCRRSANPVGRLMLHLYGAASPPNIAESDAICTGLQLTNFWQDIAIDFEKDRIYLPQENMQRYGVTQTHISQRMHGDAAWRALMGAQTRQARELLLSGLPLTRRLGGRIGLELKLVVHGGLRILERLDQLHYDIFFHRPTLNKGDWLRLCWRMLH